MTRTCQIVGRDFYWPNMHQDINTYIATCHQCLKAKKMRFKVEVPMTIRDHAPAPFSNICVDAVGPMTRSAGGYKYIQVAVDFYSRFCIAWPTKAIDATTFTNEFFKNIVAIHGLPRSVFSDNGPTYIGETFQNFCKTFGIKNVYGTPWRPQNQGITERINGTIIQTLRTYVSENQKDWDKYLKTAVFAINNSDVYSTGISPFLLIYGRHPRLPNTQHLKALEERYKPVLRQ